MLTQYFFVSHGITFFFCNSKEALAALKLIHDDEAIVREIHTFH